MSKSNEQISPYGKMEALVAIKLNAGHTGNGNPKRVFVVLDASGNVVDAIDEGYRGHAALTSKYPGLNCGAEFPTTSAEYRRLLKEAAK